MKDDLKEPGFIERVGVLRPDGTCPIGIDTMEGDHQVVCVGKGHDHCLGCYKTIAVKTKWCTDGCRKTARRYPKYPWTDPDPNASRRRNRTRRAIDRGVRAFIACYEVPPTKMYVMPPVDEWIASVKKKYPKLRIVSLPVAAPMPALRGSANGNAVLYGRDRENRLCLGVLRISVELPKGR